MLDHLVVELVVRSLLQTEILAVLALACTASEMDEQVVQLLQSQSQLDIHTACMGYQQLYKLHRFVRLKLEEELQSICIGPSFFSFQGERDGRDNCCVLRQGASGQAQRFLTFFELTSHWYYGNNEPWNAHCIRGVSLREHCFGDEGVMSVVYALEEQIDTSQLKHLSFVQMGMTAVGAARLRQFLTRGFAQGRLPALTAVSLNGPELPPQSRLWPFQRVCRPRGVSVSFA